MAGWHVGRLRNRADRGSLVGLAVGLVVSAAVWLWPLLGLGAVAIAMWALGTPDSPACRAESWLQPHGLWHVLTALAAIAWVDRAYAAG